MIRNWDALDALPDTLWDELWIREASALLADIDRKAEKAAKKAAKRNAVRTSRALPHVPCNDFANRVCVCGRKITIRSTRPQKPAENRPGVEPLQVPAVEKV